MNNPIIERLARVETAVQALQGKPPDSLPIVEVKVRFPRGRATARTLGQENRTVDDLRGLACKIYRQKTPQGAWMVTVDLHNDEAWRGPINVRSVQIVIGRDIVYNHDARFSFLPGARLVKFYYKGDYWEHAGPKTSVPSWAPEKLAEPFHFRKVGPFQYAWSRQGNAIGGGGVGPYRNDWRHCTEGYKRAKHFAAASAMKHRCGWRTDGEHITDPGVGYALQGHHAIPLGFNYDLDVVAEWWPEAWKAAQEQVIDGQHLNRARSDAELLAEGGDLWANDYLEDVTNTVKLLWTPRDIPPTTNTLFWSLKQWDESEVGPNDGTGRSFAWYLDIIKAATLRGDVDANVLLQGFITFLLNSEGEHGEVFANRQQHYNGYARKHKGGPFENNDPLWGGHERHLLVAAMRGIDGLESLSRRMVEFAGNIGGKSLRTNGDFPPDSYGSPYPFFELAYGDLSRYGSWLAVLGQGSREPCDYTNIMNYVPHHLVQSYYR